jgi:hypothetical protein
MNRAIPAVAALVAAASCEGVFGIEHGDIVHDEDQDNIDDSVDNCPADFNPDQALAAGQRVGVACAFGSDGGDYGSAFFDPFPGPATANIEQPGWQAIDGAWTHGSDTMDLSAAESATHYLYLQGNTSFDASAIAEVHVVIGATGNSSGVGVYVGIPATGTSTQPQGVVCQVRQSVGEVVVNTYDGSGESIGAANNMLPGVAAGDEVRIVVSASGTCHATVIGGSGDTMIDDGTPAGSGLVALWTDSGPASYESIVVYTTGD